MGSWLIVFLAPLRPMSAMPASVPNLFTMERPRRSRCADAKQSRVAPSCTASATPPLRDAGDTSNVVYWDFASRRHRVVNRWSAALPQGQFGTRATNTNWWREVRGVRISSNGQLAMDSVSSRAFTEDVRWCFDKEGKAEEDERDEDNYFAK